MTIECPLHHMIHPYSYTAWPLLDTHISAHLLPHNSTAGTVSTVNFLQRYKLRYSPSVFGLSIRIDSNRINLTQQDFPWLLRFRVAPCNCSLHKQYHQRRQHKLPIPSAGKGHSRHISVSETRVRVRVPATADDDAAVVCYLCNRPAWCNGRFQ